LAGKTGLRVLGEVRQSRPYIESIVVTA